jgi:hypothetical protein
MRNIRISGLSGESHCCLAEVAHNSRITSGSADACAMPATEMI